MATDKRERQRANKAAKAEAEEIETAVEERKTKATRWGLLVVPAVILILILFFACGGDDDDGGGESFPTGAENVDATAAGPSFDVEGVVDPELITRGDIPDDFVPWAGTGALSETTPFLREGIYDNPPPMTIDTAKSYEAVIETNRGTMRVVLFDDEAPVTVNNFVNLARDGYYDGVSFHRVMEDFMAQGGDPGGTGAGGPGYSFDDELDTGFEFDSRGQLAMANSGVNTNGSQFFITFTTTEWLTGLHTIFGELVEGDEVLDLIRLRNPGTEPDSVSGDIMISVEIIES